jgi:hypothetical protein
MIGFRRKREVFLAIYHITLHAYRSWPADHPRGYVHHTDGLQPADPDIAEARDRMANFDEVKFNRKMQAILIRTAYESCRRNRWHLFGSGSELSHIHFAIGWKEFQDCDEVSRRLKNALSFVLGRDIGPRGRKWFVRGGSQKRVEDQAHLDYLLDRYFPDHPGVFWHNGQTLPEVDS